MHSLKQTVLLPIEVPKSKYCFEYATNLSCEFFDSEGGLSSCFFQLDVEKQDKKGILKNKKCSQLKQEK